MLSAHIFHSIFIISTVPVDYSHRTSVIKAVDICLEITLFFYYNKFCVFSLFIKMSNIPKEVKRKYKQQKDVELKKFLGDLDVLFKQNKICNNVIKKKI